MNMTLPQAPGEGSLSCKICPLFRHTICYWEICIYFPVAGEIFCWGLLHGRIFHEEEREIFRRRSFQGKFSVEEYAKIPKQSCFYVLLSVSILRAEMLRVIVWGEFQLKLNCLEDNFAWRGIFLRGGAARISGNILNGQRLN